jgi:hypothetical protein
MNMFKECADIKTSDMLPDLKVPDVTFHNVVVQPTETTTQARSGKEHREAKTQTHKHALNHGLDNEHSNIV